MDFFLLLLFLAVLGTSSNALQLSFSEHFSLVRITSFDFQVNSAFLSWTIRVIAEMKLKCHNEADATKC